MCIIAANNPTVKAVCLGPNLSSAMVSIWKACLKIDIFWSCYFELGWFVEVGHIEYLQIT
jgi:hypothetical protein